MIQEDNTATNVPKPCLNYMGDTMNTQHEPKMSVEGAMSGRFPQSHQAETPGGAAPKVTDHFPELSQPRLKRIGNLAMGFGKVVNDHEVTAADVVIACLTVCEYVSLQQLDEEQYEAVVSMKQFNLSQGRAVVQNGQLGLAAVFMGLADALKEEVLQADEFVKEKGGTMQDLIAKIQALANESRKTT